MAGYGSEQVETKQGTPKVYESSPSVHRSFCGDCWRPFSYRGRGARTRIEDERLAGEVYVMVGALDHPEPFEPEVHDWISQKPERVHFADKMRRYRKSSKPR